MRGKDGKPELEQTSRIVKSVTPPVSVTILRQYPRRVALLLLFLLSSSVVLAGPWTHLQGHGRGELYIQWWANDEDFDQDGSRAAKPKDGEYEEYRAELKGEYGLTDRVDLLVSVPLKRAQYEDNTGYDESTTGIADLGLAVKCRITPNRKARVKRPPSRGSSKRHIPEEQQGMGLDPEGWVVAVQAGVKVPSGYDETDAPSLGPGQTDMEALLLIGRAFGTRNAWGSGYAYGSAGYRYRDEDPTDQLLYGLELGMDVAWIKGLRAKATASGADGFDSDSGVEEDYHNYTVGLIKDFGDLNSPTQRGRGIAFEIGFGQTVAGRNTGAGAIGFAKLACQF